MMIFFLTFSFLPYRAANPLTGNKQIMVSHKWFSANNQINAFFINSMQKNTRRMEKIIECCQNKAILWKSLEIHCNGIKANE